MTHTVNLAPLSADAFALPQKGTYPVINILPGQIVTPNPMWPRRSPRVIASGKLRKIAVIERHHATGNIGVGLIAGYGLTRGRGGHDGRARFPQPDCGGGQRCGHERGGR
jgi:adenine deaminase